MPVTITHGSTTVTPDLVLGYERSSETTNVFHELAGNAAGYVSLGTESPRTGTLRMLFADRADALAAEDMHRQPGSFVLVDTELDGDLDMTYVREGELTLQLNSSRKTWTLEVGYREIA